MVDQSICDLRRKIGVRALETHFHHVTVRHQAHGRRALKLADQPIPKHPRLRRPLPGRILRGLGNEGAILGQSQLPDCLPSQMVTANHQRLSFQEGFVGGHRPETIANRHGQRRLGLDFYVSSGSIYWVYLERVDGHDRHRRNGDGHYLPATPVDNLPVNAQYGGESVKVGGQQAEADRFRGSSTPSRERRGLGSS